jgi:hypothetical protein
MPSLQLPSEKYALTKVSGYGYHPAFDLPFGWFTALTFQCCFLQQHLPAVHSKYPFTLPFGFARYYFFPDEVF